MTDQRRILIIGLDNAGKSTLNARILEHYEEKYEPKILPTVGLESNVFEFNHIEYVIFDIGGSGKFRGLWKEYLQGADIVLIVIDTDDKDTFYVARDELKELMRDVKQFNEKFVFVYNKIDLPHHVPYERIEKMISVEQTFKGRIRDYVEVSALMNENLDELFLKLE